MSWRHDPYHSHRRQIRANALNACSKIHAWSVKHTVVIAMSTDNTIPKTKPANTMRDGGLFVVFHVSSSSGFQAR